MVRCGVFQDHFLTACRVVSENPRGFGFGQAALLRLTEPGLGVNAAELKGHSDVMVPVYFKMKR